MARRKTTRTKPITTVDEMVKEIAGNRAAVAFPDGCGSWIGSSPEQVEAWRKKTLKRLKDEDPEVLNYYCEPLDFARISLGYVHVPMLDDFDSAFYDCQRETARILRRVLERVLAGEDEGAVLLDLDTLARAPWLDFDRLELTKNDVQVILHALNEGNEEARELAVKIRMSRGMVSHD